MRDGAYAMVTALMSLKLGIASWAAVSMVPQRLRRTAVTAGTRPACPSYDVDAAFMSFNVHERGIHAL
jgi:hypothetical protein